MNPRTIRRRVTRLAAATAGAAVSIAAPSAASAERVPVPGTGDNPARIVAPAAAAVGGVPGWEISLVAAAAVLAVVIVLAGMRSARRRQYAGSAP